MPRVARSAIGGIVYHVLNRGNDRKRLFDDEGDYAAFLRLLAEARLRVPAVGVLGWCIMPNHWHLVLYPKRGADDAVSTFMKDLRGHPSYSRILDPRLRGDDGIVGMTAFGKF